MIVTTILVCLDLAYSKHPDFRESRYQNNNLIEHIVKMSQKRNDSLVFNRVVLVINPSTGPLLPVVVKAALTAA